MKNRIYTLIFTFIIFLFFTSTFTISFAGNDNSNPDLVTKNYGNTSVEHKPFKILKEMTQFISRHDNYTFKAEFMYDTVRESGQKIQVTGSEKVFIQKPDKIFVEFKTDFRADIFLYNQNVATLLDTTTNLYSSAEMPGSINNALDSLSSSFGYALPLSDFFYIYPYKKIVQNIQASEFIGFSYVFGVRCNHLLFKEKDIDWQIWIEDGNRIIPRKLVITYKNLPDSPQFITIFNDWIFNEPFSPKLFKQRLEKNAQPSQNNLFRERSENIIGILND